MAVTKPNMGVLIMTKNDCYKAGRTMTPKGIVVHSTGANNPTLKRYVGPDDGILGKNTYNNHWNQPDFKKCVHAFIGKVANGAVMIYQNLPWGMRGWGVGSGSKGSYNTSHIQFEMCEDGLTNQSYWREVRAQAVHLCAWLCQEYNIPVKDVVGHYEAHAAGYANNHGDPRNWMSKFGDSMALFRADVQAMLNGETAPEAGEITGGVDLDHYVGTVKTQKDGKISIWSDAKKSKRLCYAYDGEQVEVLGATVVGTMAPATAKGYIGFAATQYLINRQYIQEPEQPTEGGDGDKAPVTPVAPGVGIFISTGGFSSAQIAALLAALQQAQVVGTDDEDNSDAAV